jgi:hypothetical protein
MPAQSRVALVRPSRALPATRLVADVGQRAGQPLAQRAQRRALARIHVHRSVDRAAQLARQVAAHARQRGQAHADPARRRGGVAGAHGIDAGQRLVQHEPERVRVHRAGDALPARLLGGHVGERAHDVAGARERVAVGQAGDPEVGQLGDAAPLLGPVGADDVGRLDVAVDDPARVRVLERAAQRHPDPQRVAVRQLPRAQQLGQGPAVHELGDQVDRVAVAAGLVQADDAGVRQPGRGDRLALGAHVEIAVDGDPLDRHVALQVLVVRPVDDPHPAGAEALAQAVAGEHELDGRAGLVSGRGGRVGVRHRLVIRGAQGGSLLTAGRKRPADRKVAG